MNFNQLRNRLFIASVSLGLASTIGVFIGNERIKTLGFSGIGAGIASVVSLEIISGVTSKENERIKKASQEDIKTKEKVIADNEKRIINLEVEAKSKVQDIEKQLKDLSNLEFIIQGNEATIKVKNLELIEAYTALGDLKGKLQKVGEFNASESHRIVRKTYDRQVKKVRCVLDAMIRNHSDYQEYFQSILDEFETYKIKFLKKIEEYEAVDTFDDLLDIGLELQEMIIDKSFELRSKAQQILIKDFGAILDDSVPVDELEEIINTLTGQAKEKIELVESNLEADKRAIASEWVVSNEQIVQNYQTNYTDVLNSAKEAVNRLDVLEAELAELRKPLQLYGDSTYARAANSVSGWYYSKYQYLLDAITWEETETGFKILFSIRRNPGLTEQEIYADNSREQLAAFTNALHPTLPEFEFNRQNSTATLTVQLRRKVKKVVTPEEFTQNLRDALQPPEALIKFVGDAYHVGLWAETGSGKTTAMSNIIGGMFQELGGAPEIRTTIPKIDDEVSEIFPTVDWLGVPNSIFGMLEAALEIQYRIHKNEEAYLKKQKMPSFSAIIFFIDEINLIFSRWKRINEADMENVLSRFKETISGERLEYFEQFMQIELMNYKNEFAKRLLLFIWQTGRSLKVKSLIAGQNLMPGNFGIMKNDLANCSYLALGDAIDTCKNYKVKSSYLDEITSQKEQIDEGRLTDPSLKFTGLYCPSLGKPFFGIMPAPNSYKWNVQEGTNNSNLSNQEKYSSINEKGVQQGLSAMSGTMYKTSDNVDIVQKDCPQENTGEVLSDRVLEVCTKLSEPFKNLQYEGMASLYAKLPKKADGSVRKTLAYSQVFKVKRRDEQKIYSEFIDLLEAEFKL